MINKNVADNLFWAVEDYNTTMTDKKRQFQFEHMSYDEIRGIFYNCLRRRFRLSNGSCHDIDIKFREDYTIIGFTIKLTALTFGSYQMDDKWMTIRELSVISKEIPELEKTRILNEMRLIVHSLNK